MLKHYEWTFPNALDAGDLTWTLYGAPTDEMMYGVLIGPDGRIVTRGPLWAIKPEIERALPPRAAGAAPPRARLVADLLRRGEPGKALAAARRLPEAPTDIAAWRAQEIKTLEERKRARWDQIVAWAGTDGTKFHALQAAECFLRGYGAEPEAAEARSLISKLKSDSAVKRELAAKELFYRAAECLAGGKAAAPGAAPFIEKLRREFADTVYGRCATSLKAT